MIRGTINEGIISAAKKGNTASIVSSMYDTVLAGASEAAAVITEKRQIDTPEVFQTTTPSDHHNGPSE